MVSAALAQMAFSIKNKYYYYYYYYHDYYH